MTSVGAELLDLMRLDIDDLPDPETVEAELQGDPSSGAILDGVRRKMLLASREPDAVAILHGVGSGLHGRFRFPNPA